MIIGELYDRLAFIINQHGRDIPIRLLTVVDDTECEQPMGDLALNRSYINGEVQVAGRYIVLLPEGYE